MRPIDADALIVKQASIAKTFARSDAQKSLMGRVMYNTENAPTIDAIPVEWLEKKREDLILTAMVHSTVYGDNSVELCHAVNMVLDMWQKEQEARST